MGQFFAKLKNSLLPKKEKTLLMLGLDAAGKTTILYKLKLTQETQSIPICGLNYEIIEYGNMKYSIWDVDYQLKLVRRYHPQPIHAIIYVIDSSDVERIQQSKEAIEEVLLSNDDLRRISLLIFANKQDIGKISVKEISEQLNLNNIQEIGEWHIQGCCALEGEGLFQGLDWLSQKLHNIPNNTKQIDNSK